MILLPIIGRETVDKIMEIRSKPIENNGVTIDYVETDVDPKYFKFSLFKFKHIMMVPNKCTKSMLLQICKTVKVKYVAPRLEAENARLVQVANSVHDYIHAAAMRYPNRPRHGCMETCNTPSAFIKVDGLIRICAGVKLHNQMIIQFLLSITTF